MTARQMFPLPVQSLWNHPEFIALPAAGRGILITLLLYYWAIECRPMPTKETELFAVARANPATWRFHRDTIFRIFNELRPELEAYFLYRKRTKEHLREIGETGGSVVRLRALAKKQARHGDRLDKSPLRDADEYQRVMTPEERGARTRAAPTRKG